MSKPSLSTSKPPRPALPNKPTAQQILDGINGGGYSPSTSGSGSQPTTGTGDGIGASPSASGGGSDPSSSSGSGSTTGLTGPGGSIGFGPGEGASTGSGSGPSNTGDSGASSSANNDNGPSSSNGSGTSGLGTGGASSSSATGSDPLYVKNPAMSKPSLQGDQEDVNDTDGDSSIIRPRPYRPFKPHRPYKPEPAIQVQQGPDPNDNEDSSTIGKDGVQCYRSGMDCISDAEHFACCTRCINGICI